MEAMKVLARAGASVLVGVLALLGTMAARCTDQSGSSWERCRSWLGQPILEWPGGDFAVVVPILFGLGAGLLTWMVLRHSFLGRHPEE